MKLINRLNNKQVAFNKWLHMFVGLLIAIFLITSAVKFTLNFRALYYFDIDYLNITDYTHLNKSEIIENYDALIDYLKTTNSEPLEFPSLKMSKEGRIHFVDVKNIFVKLDYLMITTLIISLTSIYFFSKYRALEYMKWASLFLLVLPIGLAIPFAVDFNETFNLFHELFFSNDYWLFNPSTDPVINILPQAFFMHNAILILLMITLESFLLFHLYRLFLKKQSK